VRIPRKEAGSSNPEILRANGGTSYFKALGGPYPDTINSEGNIVPYVDSLYTIGTTGTRWAYTYTDNLIGLGAQHQTNTIATSMSTNNYQKLADGSIIQWGRLNDTTDPKVVTFPVTFGSPPVVTCATYRSSNGSNGYNHIYDLSTSGVSLVLDGVDGYWIAVGNLPTS
jgi:hypothetical protein